MVFIRMLAMDISIMSYVVDAGNSYSIAGSCPPFPATTSDAVQRGRIGARRAPSIRRTMNTSSVSVPRLIRSEQV